MKKFLLLLLIVCSTSLIKAQTTYTNKVQTNTIEGWITVLGAKVRIFAIQMDTVVTPGIRYADGTIQITASSQARLPDSSVVISGTGGLPTTDSANLMYIPSQRRLGIGGNINLNNTANSHLFTIIKDSGQLGEMLTSAYSPTGSGAARSVYGARGSQRYPKQLLAQDFIEAMNWRGYMDMGSYTGAIFTFNIKTLDSLTTSNRGAYAYFEGAPKGGVTRKQILYLYPDSTVAKNNLVGDSAFSLKSIKTITAATYNVGDNEYTILADATGAAITINLPAASSMIGRLLNIKKIDASINTVTIDGNASETIDGATTKVISIQYTNIQLQCDGTAWYILQ